MIQNSFPWKAGIVIELSKTYWDNQSMRIWIFKRNRFVLTPCLVSRNRRWVVIFYYFICFLTDRVRFSCVFFQFLAFPINWSGQWYGLLNSSRPLSINIIVNDQGYSIGLRSISVQFICGSENGASNLIDRLLLAHARELSLEDLKFICS